MTSPATQHSSVAATRRLLRDLQALHKSQNPQITVRPSHSSLLEWHFVLHSFEPETPYYGGIYHGRLLFPPEYPHAPPMVMMETPSGRLEVGCRLCLSMTDFHPENWNPAWSVETILVGLLSFFVSDAETGYGSLHQSEARRRELAAASRSTNARNPDFVALFPEFDSLPAVVAGPVDSDSPAERGSALLEAEIRARADSDVPMECWICREPAGNEVLVRPCRCRGSMSGVHPSCVERWVAYHRRVGGSSGRPKCSVCQMSYSGHEAHPGLVVFARHQLWGVGEQLGRSTALVGVLMGFQDASHGSEAVMPLPARLAVAALFWSVAFYKFAILMVSLPPQRLPPRGRHARRFFVSDAQSLARHVAEALAITAVVVFWCLSGELPLTMLIPICIAALILAARLCTQAPTLACLARVICEALYIPFMPVALLGALLVYLPRNIRRAAAFAHPLDVGPHVVVAFSALLLCFLCKSNVPVIALWAVATVALAACLVERAAFRCFAWRRGAHWWLALQLAAMSCYAAAALPEFAEGFSQPNTRVPVLVAAVTWLTALSCLAVSVNWDHCVRQYKAWQRRHGTFTLVTPASRVVAVTSHGDEDSAV